MLRRSLMRYMNLALILVLRSISSAVKQRFPTLEHVVEAGFMTNQEKELFQAVPCNEFNTYWIPCTWFIYRLQEAAKRGKLLNHYALETIMRVILRKITTGRSLLDLLWHAMCQQVKLNSAQFHLHDKIIFAGILRVPSQMWAFVVL